MWEYLGEHNTKLKQIKKMENDKHYQRASENTPIFASQAGEVIESEKGVANCSRDIRGAHMTNRVTIGERAKNKNGLYELIRTIVHVIPNVKLGSRVKPGDLIGYSGGHCGKAHLHEYLLRLEEGEYKTISAPAAA